MKIARSGIGTCNGSIIHDEETVSSLLNDNITKVASALRSKDGEANTKKIG